MKPGAAVRACAARTIAEVLRGNSLDRALESHLPTLPERDQPLCREICFGTLRQYPRLNALLNQLLQKPLRAKDRDVHALALAGLYQLTSMRIPAHAAVSATVDAATVLKKRQLSGLLNAVLRRFQREEDALNSALSEAAAAAQPDWLWDALGEHWPEYREQIAQANNSHPPMTLRVNLSRIERDTYQQQLANAGISSHAGALSPAALTLEQAVDVTQLPGFGDGLCSVQDEAAQLAALLLAPKAGERILDACAAPGGKSCHILEQQSTGLSLISMDISEERLHRVQENLDRLGLSATLLACDGATPSAALRESAPFDAMLLDVPCSATGVIRRHPDVKILRREEDARSFAAQQRAILDGVWPLLKAGGRLLYVTCSILPEENSQTVAEFLARQNDATEETLDLASTQACSHGLQLLPDISGTDGLYFAMLRKQG
ncbi:16S rRNA (cytosine(967)-C(5))-methyltransferase RsmB [Congregibacter variabilis]|uniref:16S rRNA (cytosine(967)-C(5))-methyltransferase n=1 Tax=Congregibacter variabilis TaxID=3081200 RepID=A0ABZ0HZ12_9GAMM|nr:16S rRNA (cytosine(967)-C(5))-methyltransferase RsmB [Congregibacter sp. IMCC43200]